MKNRYQKFLSSVLASVIALVLLFSVLSADEGKMPVTSSSEAALENYWKGIGLTDKLRFPDARPFFEQAVAEDPNFAVAYMNLGFTVASAKGFFENLEKAKSVMDKASEAERMWILGVDAGAVGDPQKQFGHYKKLVENYPKDERARNLLAVYYFGQQEYELAVEQLNAAVKIEPEYSQPYNMLGYSNRFLKKYDEAEKAFKKYIELIPDDPNPYDSYAEFLMKVGRYEESIEQYRKALEFDPTFAASYIGIATNNNFLGNYEEARKAAQELFDNAVNDGQRRAAHFTKAVSYVDEGDYDNAIKEFEKQMVFAKQIDDAANMAGDLAGIGNLMLEQNKPDAALANYRLAMDVVQESNLSDEFKANNRLGFLFNECRAALKKGEMAKAKDNQEKYATQAEANQSRFQIWAAHQLAGMIALEEKDYQTAITELKQSNLQNMNNLYRLVLAYKGAGDKENAKKTCEELVKYNQLNSINYSLRRHEAKKLMASL
jgi:tetratricopeptide (TPR) repeat protein